MVLALYRYGGAIDAAVDQVNAITGYQGLGHTCGIHTSDPTRTSTPSRSAPRRPGCS